MISSFFKTVDTSTPPASSIQKRCKRQLVQTATLALLASALVLSSGCSSTHEPTSDISANSVPSLSNAQILTELNQYKVQLAQRIAQTNPTATASGRPQPMLRSVVVVAFKVDKQGKLLTSSVYRSNGDKLAERLALASLKQASPLPAPPASLVGRNEGIEITEGWLFNNDGHFQLRSIAPTQYSFKR